MVYQSVSLESVISRIIRNTRLTDSSAINDLYEWIPEAMELMETKFELAPLYKDIEVDFHYGKLPCGLRILQAVAWEGYRLPFSHTALHPASVPTRDNGMSNQQVFQSVRSGQVNPVTGDYMPWFDEGIEAIIGRPVHTKEYYQLNRDCIITSFPEGKVRVYYLSVPMDEKGLPLVPDNANYKEGLYYYCRAKLIVSGQFEDRVLTERECMQRFEVYAERAMNEISWPSEDRMQEMVDNQVRLIFPMDYWENYGLMHKEGTIYE